ncbi:hypothetical protein HOC80_03865 [archaeon]|jgi:uncharacterized membrane-anchored protein YhcB (DUF1043 family)|nr:hypothetical protein [archaeon]MBT4417213.1 hypothetical protein [archaeon]
MEIEIINLIVSILTTVLLIICYILTIRSSKMLKEIKPEFDELNKKLDEIHSDLKKHISKSKT